MERNVSLLILQGLFYELEPEHQGGTFMKEILHILMFKSKAFIN